MHIEGGERTEWEGCEGKREWEVGEEEGVGRVGGKTE